MSNFPDTDLDVASPRRRLQLKTSPDRGLLVVGIIALTAIGLAAWALLRPAPGSDPDYSDAQRADAKSKTCAAFDVVRRGVKLNTSIKPPGGPEDLAGNLAVVANARLAAYAGGLYLLDRLEPATPPELADEVRGFATVLTDIGAAATAGAGDSDPDQAARLKDADAAATKLGELCK